MNLAGSVRDVPEESLMLTGDENIIDVEFTVFWVINDAGKYLFNIRNPEQTVKAAAEFNDELDTLKETQAGVTRSFGSFVAADKDLLAGPAGYEKHGDFTSLASCRRYRPSRGCVP